MLRGEIHQPEYKPHFSGHETFPLRYGWLKKACDAAARSDEDADVFNSDEAIAYFGVGRNMVSALKFWGLATGVLSQASARSAVELSPLGDAIFGKHGCDPYTEHPSTLWALHWNLCSPATRTTWHWTLNYLSHPTFEREQVVERIFKLAKQCGWPRVAKGTIKRDVECFLRSYTAKHSSGDDPLESPFVELGLIQSIGKRDGFRLNVGRKPSLEDGVFAYAVSDFWGRSTEANTINFESLAYEPGSPGRVFRLEEDDLVERLTGLGDTTDGELEWSETAGLKQLTRQRAATAGRALDFLLLDYPPESARSAA
ncbi:DUF4007 family protein [Maricaulis maris]|uniref:DUF4007 family protein n=1 Tax=Maricaulis maris TaxID=74318 RepID=UPI0029220830|nr:hypothetical protein MACH15_01610 [Maricaulis maris]